MWRLVILVSSMLLVACGATKTAPATIENGVAEVLDDEVITDDGYRLPLHRWETDDEPQGIVLALHGFNDYGAGFKPLAQTLTKHGFTVYAYDQRGFGDTSTAGSWPGQAVLVNDVREVAALLRAQHEDIPLHLIGKSLGGSLALLAMVEEESPDVDGVVLIAPAIWSRETMAWYQRFGLWVGSRLMPGLSLSANLAERIGIRPTDDPLVLENLREDPLVQRTARLDTLDDLTGLMGNALEASARFRSPALMLYGRKDEIIPVEPVCVMLRHISKQDDQRLRFVLYPEGFHMLTRYTGASMTHADIAAWLHSPAGELRSGYDMDPAGALQALCGDAPGE